MKNQLLRSIGLIILTLFTLTTFEACKKKCDPECKNGGQCVDGRCECKIGFAGASCEFGGVSGGGGSTSYNCVSGNCQSVSGNGGQYSTQAACQSACAGGGSTSYYSSPLHSYSGVASCSTNTFGNISLDDLNTDWLFICNYLPVPFMGNVNFSSQAFETPCTDCPYLIVGDESSGNNGFEDAYLAISGSGSWSGNAFNFSATLAHFDDVQSGNIGTTYSITGTMYCE